MVKFDPHPTLNPWTDRHQIRNTFNGHCSRTVRYLALLFHFFTGCAVAQYRAKSMGKRGLWPPVDLKPPTILLQKLDTLITLWGQHACLILWESA